MTELPPICKNAHDCVRLIKHHFKGNIMRKTLLISTLMAYSLVSNAFDEVEVTPANPNGWEAANVRADAMVEMNKDQPLFGDGSLMFFTDTQTAGQDKADYHLVWQQSAGSIDYPQRTLGNISALNYAWYRDSISTTADHFIPVFRLYFYDDAGTPEILPMMLQVC